MKTTLLSFTLLFAICGLSATAQTTQLWGTSEQGGLTGQGTIFTANADGSNLHTVYNFVNATGAMPEGGVTMANNGKLYGVTYLGGFGDSCVVYSYDPRTGTYTDIHDLFQYIAQGWEAWSGMVKASDGMLYGLCGAGGANGSGVIYKVDPATDTYTDIHDFISSSEGGYSYGSLKQMADGKLYGMTPSGGAHGHGTIFSFDPMSNVFTTWHSFDAISGGGSQYGNLIEATDGNLYGLTSGGALFSFDRAQSLFTKLYLFASPTGIHPNGSLLQASDGDMYGMTSLGGSNNLGVIFRFNIHTGVYTDLFDFDGINGSSPQRSLTQGSNGKLYGVTKMGGAYSSGVAFSYDLSNSTYTKLMDFNANTTGSSPNCEIVELPTFIETGIAGNAKGTIGIYPNPAVNSITISNNNREETIQFLDVIGNEISKVKTSSFGKTMVNISDFPPVFFVKTSGGEIQKIVRQ